uniref:CCHC-type domain-containing protein n=1 Tax=Romanomermis culicivorax TaxID=13658 RepID=A0A915KZW3_ROMCU
MDASKINKNIIKNRNKVKKTNIVNNDFHYHFWSFFGAPLLCKCLPRWLSILSDLHGDFPTRFDINRVPNKTRKVKLSEEAKALEKMVKKALEGLTTPIAKNLEDLKRPSKLPAESTCIRCNQKGHISQYCKTLPCYACGEIGRLARNCTKMYCNYCRETGHTKDNCPALQRNNFKSKFNNEDHFARNQNRIGQGSTINQTRREQGPNRTYQGVRMRLNLNHIDCDDEAFLAEIERKEPEMKEFTNTAGSESAKDVTILCHENEIS